MPGIDAENGPPNGEKFIFHRKFSVKKKIVFLDINSIVQMQMSFEKKKYNQTEKKINIK